MPRNTIGSRRGLYVGGRRSLLSSLRFTVCSQFTSPSAPSRGANCAALDELLFTRAIGMTMAEAMTRASTKQRQADLWDCLFLSLKEIDQLLKFVKRTANQPFLFPMIATAAHTGARKGELIRSIKTDIHEDSILIRERKRVKRRQTTRRVLVRSRKEVVAASEKTRKNEKYSAKTY